MSVSVIGQIVPQNGAFVGIVAANQVLGGGANGSLPGACYGGLFDGYVTLVEMDAYFSANRYVNITFTTTVVEQTIAVTHNLGYYPMVQVLDSNHVLINPVNIVHVSATTFAVTLYQPITNGTIIY